MAEEKSRGKKKEHKPVVKKVMGHAGLVKDLNAKKPGPPAYEHG
jgi:hypothetical protein